MITKDPNAAAQKPAQAEYDNLDLTRSRRRRLLKIGAPAMAAAITLGMLGRSQLHGQVDPLQIIPLAQGYSPKNNVIMHVKGPSDVLQADLVFQPGAGAGWHMHPGPVVVVVKSGALTEIHSNGCTTVHPTGSVFFEQAGEVHNAVNQTGGVTELVATFIFPAGTQPLISVPDPGVACSH